MYFFCSIVGLVSKPSSYFPGDICLPTNVCIVKAMVFPVVMYGRESWIVKKAERRKIDAFELGVGEDS